MSIKNYKLFLESDLKRGLNRGSIYEWFSEIRPYIWTESNIDESNLKDSVNHFLGSGEWDKINSHFTKIIQSLKKADIDFINDQLLDVFDEYLWVESKFAIKNVLYGDIERWSYGSNQRYNGSISVQNCDNQEKLKLICHFLVDILYPTLFINSFNRSSTSTTILTRTSQDEVFVTSEKYSMKNFKNIKFEIEDKLDDVQSEKLKRQRELYDSDKFLDLRRPAIFISISSDFTDLLRVDDLKRRFEEVIPAITSEIDAEEVIWPWKASLEWVNDFDLKILLKM